MMIVMLNMFVFLYADDTIVLAENASELQKASPYHTARCGRSEMYDILNTFYINSLTYQNSENPKCF